MKRLIIIIVIILLPVIAINELIKSNQKPTHEDIVSLNNSINTINKYYEDHPE